MQLATLQMDPSMAYAFYTVYSIDSSIIINLILILQMIVIATAYTCKYLAVQLCIIVFR